MLPEYLKEDLENIITEMPTAMECGRKCNSILPLSPDRGYTHTKGMVIGGLLGGPFGFMYGSHLALNSLQSLCRTRCKFEKKKAQGINDPVLAQKVQQKLNKAKAMAHKIKNTEGFNSLINKIMSTRF